MQNLQKFLNKYLKEMQIQPMLTVQGILNLKVKVLGVVFVVLAAVAVAITINVYKLISSYIYIITTYRNNMHKIIV